MLKRAKPPVNFVPKGESVMFRMKTYIDGGNPLFNPSGFVQLYLALKDMFKVRVSKSKISFKEGIIDKLNILLNKIFYLNCEV